MGTHRRRTPLLLILHRLGWQRDPARWSVSCLDAWGRADRLEVFLGPDGLVIRASVGTWRLQPLEAGRLRWALRAALITRGQLGETEHVRGVAVEPAPDPPVPVGVPQRRRVTLTSSDRRSGQRKALAARADHQHVVTDLVVESAGRTTADDVAGAA